MTGDAVPQSVGLKPRSMAVDIRQVHHEFDLGGTRLPVLDSIDLNLAPGEFVALIGPSGCGKSTLLRLLAGLEKPSRGSILVDGKPIGGPHPSRNLVFQDPTLFPWATVWKNVATGLEARGVLKREHDRVDKAIALVGLETFRDALPHQLSGGMAQRVALARALVNDPSLLLLDEPLGKLDSFTRMTLQAELDTLWRRSGFTALLVTHDIEEALLLASRVIVLSDRPGRIIAEIEVDLDYPRKRDDETLVKLRSELLELTGYGRKPQAAKPEFAEAL